MIDLPAGYQFTIISWLMFGVAVLALGVAGMAWRWRDIAGARYLVYLEVSVAIWCFGAGVEAAAPTVALKEFWSQIHYIGTVSAPLFFFLFSMTLAQQQTWLTRRNIALLWIIPVLTLAIAFTNPWHGWLWPEITISGNGLAVYSRGPYWWLFLAYSYSLIFGGMLVLVINIWRFPAYYRTQIWALLAGAALPTLASVLYVLRLVPVPGLDWTPIAFLISGICLAWAIFRFQLFRLIPVARNRLVDSLQDGVLVFDTTQRVVDLNPAMQAILGQPADLVLGRPVNQVLPDWLDLPGLLHPHTDVSAELSLPGDRLRLFDVRVSPLFRRSDSLIGWLVVLHDITAGRQLANEREKLITELQDALAHIKTLRGLLPICANCKRIRDDDGQWQRVEEYVREHSEADFSHGICPDCMGKLYGDFLPAKK
jgi:PAS domain S-box-containing protein